MSPRRHLLWLPVLFAHCAALAILFPDSYQQDGGCHFLLARDAWKHPQILIGVWARPVFTLLYSLPAQIGYLPAKLFTGAVLAGTAWYAWRIAASMHFLRPWLVFLLLPIQPVVLLLSFDTMTEPLFALFLVAALHYRRAGRPWLAAVLVSFLPTIRPEGFFVAAFWGGLLLLDRRFRPVPVLAFGAILWWLAAWALTGDFFWLVHNWSYRGRDVYGHGDAKWILDVGAEAWGPFVFPLVLIGLGRELACRRWTLPALALFFWALQSVLWLGGLFGSAGYARYFVCVAPVAALLALSALDLAGRPVWKLVWTAALAGGLTWAWIHALRYVDAQPWLRDAFAVREAYASYSGPKPRRLAFSQAYMAVLFDVGAENALPAFRPREEGLERLRELGPGTVIFWDREVGPAWFRLDGPDFEAAGFRLVYAKQHRLPSYARRLGIAKDLLREQEIRIYVKE